MGKRKKRAKETQPAEQAQLFAPDEPQARPSALPNPTPPDPLAPPLPGDPAKGDSMAFLDKIRADAILWAQECGLKPPFTVNGPERVAFPKEGHGYVVTIKEETGKQRLGSARFNSNGAPSYWSLDGIEAGRP